MSEAPGKVWVEFRDQFVDIARWNDAKGGTEYIRADVSADLERQLAEARDKALEEAAKACDRLAGNAADFDRYARKAAGMCAADIRNLKGTP